jgi:hypothetical protein
MSRTIKKKKVKIGDKFGKRKKVSGQILDIEDRDPRNLYKR